MGKLSLSYQILIAVLLGILVGLFFGPYADYLRPLGSIYTMFLQMAILPYICFSLIHGIGSLSPAMGKKLFKSSWPYLLLLWGVTFSVIYLVSKLVPNPHAPLLEAQSEFSTNFGKNFLTYLIPENPFYDIVNNVVPAIAIFGVISGVALMHIEKKEPLVSFLERVNQAIEKVFKWLGILSPIAAFVYISIAFGTIHFEDFYGLGIFICAFIFTALFIVFVILPTLLTSLTTMTYKDVMRAFRYVCLIPFVTGLVTAAFPFLYTFLKKISHMHEEHPRFRATSQTILPIAYSFANVGNAMIFFFTIFLGYYYRHPFTGMDKFLISILTIPLSLGSSTSNLNSALFLIQQLGLPTAATDLFLQIKSIVYNFHVLMSIASVVTLILLVLYSYYGLLHVQWKKLATCLSSALVLFAVLVFSIKISTHPSDVYESLYLKLSISNAISHPPAAKFLAKGETGTPRSFPEPLFPDALHHILSSKVLKVAYWADSPPFCYYNEKKEVVGFDIAYAYQLAHDLDCTLEFVPLDYASIGKDLLNGLYDIGMSAISMTEERLKTTDFTFPYFDDSNVLIVPLKRLDEFLKLDDVRKRTDLKIGAYSVQYRLAKQIFPKAKILEILEEKEALDSGEIDAYLWAKTMSKVWCVLNPNYVAIDYGKVLGPDYFSYPIRLHATDFGFFLNNWLTVKEQSGFKKAMQTYWIDGIIPGKRPPRWSILRNVLHFVP